MREKWLTLPRSPTIVLGIYTVLTLVMTYPLVFNLTTAVPNDIGDPLLNTWILAWDVHALLTDPLNFFNANIFYPLPNTLAYSEHLTSTALLALPIQLFSGEPILAYNLSLLATFPLAAFGMYLLTLHFTKQHSAAFIGGLIFGFAPYRFAAIAHIQLLTFQWLPFALLFLDKIIINEQLAISNEQSSQTVSPKTGVPLYIAFVAFLLVQILASWYLAVYTALILGIYLAIALLARRLTWPTVGKLAGAFAVTALLVFPLVFPYLSLVNELRTARPLSLALSLAAAPTDFIAAAPFNTFLGPLTESLRTRPNFTEENTLYISLTAIVLALIPLLYYAVRIVTRLLGLTSRTTHHAPRSTSRIPLSALIILAIAITFTFSTPYAVLSALIPFSTIIRVPPRWIIPALFALADLAAIGYAFINEQLTMNNEQPPHPKSHIPKTILFVTCTTLIILESLSIPIPLAPVDNHQNLNPAYRWLAQQPDDFALIELPLHSAPAPEYPEVKRLYASTLSWWPLINGYSGYTPPRQPELAKTISGFPYEQSIAGLQTINNSKFIIHHSKLYLLVHPGEAPFNRTQWETNDRWQAQRNPALLPLGQYEGDTLYQVLPADPERFSAPPFATFGSAQNIQLLTFSFIQTPGNLPGLILYWQAAAPPAVDHTIFIHLRADDDYVLKQADSPPVSGRYPTTAWQANEIIQDIHPLPASDFNQIDHIAIGLYDPITGNRLPAFNPEGIPLPDDVVIIPLPR